MTSDLSGFQQAMKQFDAIYRAGRCSHPSAPGDCTGPVIRAHSVSRAAVLNRLATDGHVFGFTVDHGQMLRGRVEPRRVGVREASTFSGFCSRHDGQLFRPLDEPEGFRLDDETVFLLTYRALVREGYLKECQLATHRLYAQDAKLQAAMSPDLARDVSDFFAGVQLGVEDYHVTKQEYDAVLRERAFSRTRYCAIALEAPPQLATSNAVQPEVDFLGHPILAPGSLLNRGARPRMVAQNVLPTAAHEVTAVFSWVDDNPAADQLIGSLLALHAEAIPAALVRYAFEFSENVFFAPDWWLALPAEVREALTERFNRTLGLEVVRDHDALADDGIRPVRWTMTGRRTARTRHLGTW